MTHKHIPAPEQQALWAEAARQVAGLDWEPPVSLADADALHARMPPRGPGETIEDWVRRAFGQVTTASADRPLADVSFLPPPAGKRLRVIGEALAWAAAEPAADEVRLPPQMEIGPGDFRVGFLAVGGEIRVTLEALGFTLARLAGQEVVVSGPEGLGQILAILTLDPFGEGDFALRDSRDARTLLLALKIGELEPL